jgi:hypothetical protein
VELTPVGAAAVDAVESEDRLYYADVQEDTDYILQATPLGLEAFWQLRSEKSPSHLRLALGIPEGARLITTPVGDGTAAYEADDDRGYVIEIRATDMYGHTSPPRTLTVYDRPTPRNLIGEPADETYSVATTSGFSAGTCVSDPVTAFIKGTSPNGTAYTEGKNIWLTEAGPVVRMRNGTQTDDLERRSPAGAGGRFEQFLTRMTGKLEDGGTTERYKRVSRLYVYSYRGDTDCKRLNYENYVPKLDGKKVQCFDSGLVNFDFTPRPAYTTYKGYAGP